MRYVYITYGDVSKIQLKASAKPLDALLQTGFDLYLEVAPKRWVRAVDLPNGHPAMVNLSAGAYKAGLIDANGQTFTILNAYNAEHRTLAAREGLYINAPFTEQKRQEIEEVIQKILDELEQQVELKELSVLANKIERRIKKLRETKEPKEKHPIWDSIVNNTLSLTETLEKAVELSNEIFPSKNEQWAIKQAVKQAKKEAAMETAMEESILLNPEKMKDLRRKLLE
jgi:hypothetical protein